MNNVMKGRQPLQPSSSYFGLIRIQGASLLDLRQGSCYEDPCQSRIPGQAPGPLPLEQVTPLASNSRQWLTKHTLNSRCAHTCSIAQRFPTCHPRHRSGIQSKGLPLVRGFKGVRTQHPWAGLRGAAPSLMRFNPKGVMGNDLHKIKKQSFYLKEEQ